MLGMSKTLVLPDAVYQRLASGAARRGLTVKSLLNVVSEAVVPRIPYTAEDRRRGEKIERLFAKYRAGPLSPAELAELDRLIDRTYEVAIERADRMIAEKTASSKRQNGSRSGQQSRAIKTAGR
jgi:hypothetical protein